MESNPGLIVICLRWNRQLFFCRQDGAPSLSDDIRVYNAVVSVCISGYACVFTFKELLCSTREIGLSFPNDMPLNLESVMLQTEHCSEQAFMKANKQH